MCKPVKCPQCGHEFTPERAKIAEIEAEDKK